MESDCNYINTSDQTNIILCTIAMENHQILYVLHFKQLKIFHFIYALTVLSVSINKDKKFSFMIKHEPWGRLWWQQAICPPKATYF